MDAFTVLLDIAEKHCPEFAEKRRIVERDGRIAVGAITTTSPASHRSSAPSAMPSYVACSTADSIAKRSRVASGLRDRLFARSGLAREIRNPTP